MNDSEHEKAFGATKPESRVALTRATGRRDRSRYYSVRFDGELRGKLRPGDSLELLTSEGDHVLEVTLDQSARTEIRISTKANEVSSFVVQAGDLRVAGQSWIEIVADEGPTD